MKKQYYYLDITFSTKKLVNHRITEYATHTGDTRESEYSQSISYQVAIK